MAENFCPECGERHEPEAQFCESCGHRFAESRPDQAPTEIQEPVELQERVASTSAAAPAGSIWQRPWPWLVAIAAIAAIAVVVVLLLGGNDEDGAYADEVASAIAPVAEANDALSDELGGLGEGDDPSSVSGELRAGLRAVRDSQGEVELIDVPESERDLRTSVDEAMSAQVRYLSAVARALRQPSETTAAELGPRADAARTAWSRVSASIAGAGGRIAGADNLAAWARAEARIGQEQPPADQGASEEAAPAPAREAVSCGGLEGIISVFAGGVDCDTALRVATGQVGSGAPGEGFSCAGEPSIEPGATAYNCTRDDGAFVSFEVFE